MTRSTKTPPTGRTAHTAGPWTTSGTVRRFDRDPFWWRGDVIAGGVQVARVSGTSEDAARANARLIAASPTLLAASLEMVDALEYRFQSMADAPEHIAKAWDSLKVAIAHVEGRA